MVLFYTGVHYHEPDPENIHACLHDRFESCQMSVASDDGTHFDNFGGKRVVIPPVVDKKVGDWTHTRDPKVWKGEDGWYMILGSRSVGSFFFTGAKTWKIGFMSMMQPRATAGDGCGSAPIISK